MSDKIGKVLKLAPTTYCISFSVGEFTFDTNRVYITREDAEEVLLILRGAWSAGFLEAQRIMRVAMGVKQ